MERMVQTVCGTKINQSTNVTDMETGGMISRCPVGPVV